MGRRTSFALLGLLLLSCAAVPFSYADDADADPEASLEKELEVAETAQEIGDTHVVVSELVEAAAPAELASGDGDINTVGSCMQDIQIFCPDTKPGEGRLYTCLKSQLSDEAAGKSEVTASISATCKDELTHFKLDRSTNINKNVPLSKACRSDAAKLCGYTKGMDETGKVIACLRELKDQLTQRCRSAIVAVQIEAADDWRTDPQLKDACTEDVDRLCAEVPAQEGLVQICLRDKRPQLSWGCQEELFRQQVEDADDIRLSERLFRKCLNDKKKFCADVAPGNARVKECLEESINQPGFSSECSEELTKMMENRARDFRLDVRVRKNCGTDIELICGFQRDSLDTVNTEDARVIECLQDFRQDLTQPACRKAVKRTMERAARDIRLDASLADACFDDRRSLCGNIPPGDARVIRCLQDARDRLATSCRVALFDEEVRTSESIDFQYPMKTACKTELTKFCKDVPHNGGLAIRCLQEHKDKTDFGSGCRDAVTSFEHKESSDYRLNYRLTQSCESDIIESCGDICPSDTVTCGGRVLRCLTEKVDALKSEDCAKEVNYFMKMEVTDYGNDVILAEACRGDVDAHCADVKPGEGRVHECLRANRDKLSGACRKEELALEVLESGSIDLRPSLKRSCAEERSVFCKSVPAGSARVFRCLVENMSATDFGPACKGELVKKIERRQQNWKLDVNMRKHCKASVAALCADVVADDKAAVQKCMLAKLEDVDEPCVHELARAVHMAFMVYKPKSALTGVCDADVTNICLKETPSMLDRPGEVGACLKAALEPPPPAEDGTETPPVSMSEECKQLVQVAEQPNASRDFKGQLVEVALIHQLQTLEKRTNLQLINTDGTGVDVITLTGWTALCGVFALCAVLIVGGVYIWKRTYGIPEGDGYQMVVKSGAKDGDV